ncbi:MAG: preprotein translocase subunit YajC [Chloroflexi bacterium]|nr:preprotein translocase subunit YajC [Chloroflexota bacterium]
MESQQTYILIGLVVLSALMFLPQWQARRRRQKQVSALQVGDRIMTVSGVLGKLTYYDAEENRARVEIAPGIEITMVTNGVSRPMPDPVEQEGESTD